MGVCVLWWILLLRLATFWGRCVPKCFVWRGVPLDFEFRLGPGPGRVHRQNHKHSVKSLTVLFLRVLKAERILLGRNSQLTNEVWGFCFGIIYPHFSPTKWRNNWKMTFRKRVKRTMFTVRIVKNELLGHSQLKVFPGCEPIMAEAAAGR